MKRNKLLHLFLSAVMLLNVAGLCFAQSTTARLTGTVVDSNGAVVPDATVTLTNEETNISFTTETTSAGTYSFDALQVGSYSVTVEKQGFKKFVSTSNKVVINQPLTVNVTMEVGGVSEVVQVQAAAELVQSSSSGNFGQTVEQRSLETLPIVA